MARNRLSQIDAIKLSDWMREKQSEIENGMTGPQVARIARRELGITFKNSQRATNQTSRVHVVAQSVARLYETLGEEVPEELADLIQ